MSQLIIFLAVITNFFLQFRFFSHLTYLSSISLFFLYIWRVSTHCWSMCSHPLIVSPQFGEKVFLWRKRSRFKAMQEVTRCFYFHIFQLVCCITWQDQGRTWTNDHHTIAISQRREVEKDGPGYRTSIQSTTKMDGKFEKENRSTLWTWSIIIPLQCNIPLHVNCER